jgi:hypothetical protein
LLHKNKDEKIPKRKMVKKIWRHISIIMFGFIAIATSDSRAAVLCKKQSVIFICPIVENMMTKNGISYDYVNGTIDAPWNITGPWGNVGTNITVNGNSRCSETNGSYLNIGNPSAEGGQYCWCQMTNNSLSGVWVFAHYFSEILICVSTCAHDCAYYAQASAIFRSAVCVPPTSQSSNCDGTTIIADNACPAGYVQCIGYKSSSDTAGNYTITCSE